MRCLHQASSQSCFLGFLASVKHSLLWTRLRNSQPSAGITQKLDWRCSCNCQVIMYQKWLIFHVQLGIWHCLDFITCFHFRNFTLSSISFWRKDIFIWQSLGLVAGSSRRKLVLGLLSGSSYKLVPCNSSWSRRTFSTIICHDKTKFQHVWSYTPSNVKDSHSSPKPTVIKNWSIIPKDWRMFLNFLDNSTTVHVRSFWYCLIKAVL